MTLTDLLSTLSGRLATNVSTSIANLTPQQWIRLIVIVCAYMLIRPYIIKLGARVQMRRHEEEEKRSEEEAQALLEKKKAKLSPNDLRDGVSAGSKVSVPAESDSEDEDENDAAAAADANELQNTAAVTATDWGKKARRRQRHMLRKLLQAHEQQLADQQADEEDKDIQEFLVE